MTIRRIAAILAITLAFAVMLVACAVTPAPANSVESAQADACSPDINLLARANYVALYQGVQAASGDGAQDEASDATASASVNFTFTVADEPVGDDGEWVPSLMVSMYDSDDPLLYLSVGVSRPDSDGVDIMFFGDLVADKLQASVMLALDLKPGRYFVIYELIATTEETHVTWAILNFDNNYRRNGQMSFSPAIEDGEVVPLQPRISSGETVKLSTFTVDSLTE